MNSLVLAPLHFARHHAGSFISICGFVVAYWSGDAVEGFAFSTGIFLSGAAEKNRPQSGVSMNMNRGKKRHLYKGQLYTTAEAAALAGVTREKLYSRMRRGWSVEYAIEYDEADYKQTRTAVACKWASIWLYQGKDYSTRALADLVGISKATMWARLTRLGMTVEEAVEARRVTSINKKPAAKRRNKCKLYQLAGKEYTLNELSEMSGIPAATINSRMKKLNWPIEKAIKRKSTPRPKFWYQDDLYTIGELAEKAGCGYETMRVRLSRNPSGDRAVKLGPERAKKPPKKLTQGEDTSG